MLILTTAYLSLPEAICVPPSLLGASSRVSSLLCRNNLISSWKKQKRKTESTFKPMCLKTLENLTVLQILIDPSYHLTRKLTGRAFHVLAAQGKSQTSANKHIWRQGWVGLCSTKHQLLRNTGLGLFACWCLHGNFLPRGKF